jgi:multiple sugar transport system permease protein
MQIGKMVSYLDTMGRAVLKGQGVEIDKYITFSGDFDISKYKAFKAEIGLADILTLEKYEEMDEGFKQKNVEAAQAVLDEFEPQLAPAEEALAAAEASGDEKAIKDANEALATVRNKISRAQSDIKTPAGLLSNVNSKYSYLFVGFDNFASIFTSKVRRDTVFGSFVTTAVMWIIGFIPQVVLSLLLSAWFTDTKLHLKGLNLMKALMYLPNVITAVTVAIFFRKIFSYSSGGSVPVSQMILRFFGDEDGYNFFESAWATRLIVCFVNFWMWYGNTMIILIAGITSISVSLYESAQIDGANSVQTYFNITLPLLRPILLFLMVTSLIGGLQMYDIPMNINMNPALINFNGTMIRSTRTVLMYVNQQAFGMQDVKQVGIASSVSIILFFVTTILSICIFYLLRDKDAAKAAKEKKLAKKAARKAGAGR